MYSFLWFCFRKTRQPSCVQSLGSVFLTEVTQGYSQSYDNISDLFQPHCSWVSLLLFPTNHLLALFCISQAGICVRVLWIHSVDRRTPRTLSLSFELLISPVVPNPVPSADLTRMPSLGYCWCTGQSCSCKGRLASQLRRTWLHQSTVKI